MIKHPLEMLWAKSFYLCFFTDNRTQTGENTANTKTQSRRLKNNALFFFLSTCATLNVNVIGGKIDTKQRLRCCCFAWGKWLNKQIGCRVSAIWIEVCPTGYEKFVCIIFVLYFNMSNFCCKNEKQDNPLRMTGYIKHRNTTSQQ